MAWCWDDTYVYFMVEISNTKDGETTQVYDYYKAAFSNPVLTEITENEYSAKAVEQDGEWTYGTGSSVIYRENTKTGIRETLLAGSNYRYLANHADTVVVWEGERKSSNSMWSSPDSYKYAKIYTMDTQGNYLTEIGSYGRAAGSVTDPGSPSGTETCDLCGGTGRETCTYCHGTGKGQTISVLGQLTEQGCTYCGSAGWRVCNGCGGSGVK